MNGSELLAEILKKENIKFLSCFPSTALIESCAEINIKKPDPVLILTPNNG